MTDKTKKAYDLTSEHAAVAPTEPVYAAHAVYGDYDGNAPDTENLVACASKELADQVADLLNEYESSAVDLEEDEEHDHKFTVVDTTGNEIEFDFAESSLPFVDGWEHCKSYKTRGVFETAGQIAKTLDEALKRLGANRFDDTDDEPEEEMA